MSTTSSTVWWFPLSYILVISSKIISNAILISQDKPSIPLGYIGSWWFVVLIVAATFILEALNVMIIKFLEEF